MDQQHDEPWPAAGRAWGWVAILVLAYICSYIDRQILSLMVDLIRADLKISDSQFGLLHGLSFALLYCMLGIPFGLLADRMPRKRIIIAGILFWSLMTALCGLTRHFWQLFLTRVGVGVGEATLSPSAYSLLSDCFPRAKLGRAMSVFIAGGGLGAGIAFMVGSWLIGFIEANGPYGFPAVGALRTWQTVFLLVSIPGIVVALLLLGFREPARQGRVTADAPSWRAVGAFLAERWRFIVPFLLGVGLATMVALGTLGWAPSVLIRVYGLSAAEIGLPLGVATMIGISVGMIGSAFVAEALDRRGHADPALTLSCISLILTVPAGIALALAPNPMVALVVLTLLLALANVPFGIVGAALQSLTPNAMRGRVSAIYLLCMNALGMALGPLIPALITDTLFDGDGHMVGVSLAITIAGAATAGALALAISRSNAPAVA